MKLLFCLSLYQHYSKDTLVLDANKHGNTQNSENGSSLSYVNTTFLSSLSSIFNTFCKYYSYFASSENGDCLINNCYCYSSDELSSSFNSPFSLNDDSYQDDPISLISSSFSKPWNDIIARAFLIRAFLFSSSVPNQITIFLPDVIDCF